MATPKRSTVLTRAELAAKKRASDLKDRLKRKHGENEGAGKVNGGAYSPIARLTPLDGLTEKQRMFCNFVAEGRPATVSARMAGYAMGDHEAHKLVKKENIQTAVLYLRRQREAAGAMTRKKVMDGFVEAIDMARTMADPAVMISGWREIAKMCGYYAPEVKKIDLNITTKRVIDKLETLSDRELAEIIESSAQVIEDVPLLMDSTTSEEIPEELSADDKVYAAMLEDERAEREASSF